MAGIINKIKIEEQLENDNLQTIETDAHKITWVEKNKEALIEGKLFDVKSLRQSGKKILLTGVFDTVEDEIALRLAQLENSKEKSGLPVLLLISSLCPAELLNNQFNINFTFEPLVPHFMEFILQANCHPFFCL